MSPFLILVHVSFAIAAISAETPVREVLSSSPISVPEGFTVELAAGPPLVAHPTFATFDDRGRLFVSESAGLNLTAVDLEKQLPNSVRLLEDTDGDGRFDKSSVFADKMTFPMGGAWQDGALYVASPPNIWRLQDTDGDGVADKRDVLVGKFGDSGNAASIHGCFSGPDGRLYWTDGYHGHEFKDAAGNITSKREGSYIFSCRADGSDVRIHCGGGMDNPVEVDFTNEGEMLGTVNILYAGPRVDCFVHWLYGGEYPHREQVLSEIKVTGELLGPIYKFGHVAVSGTQRYRSGAFDQNWRDNFFVTFFNSGQVVRIEMERSGSTFRATRREFLSCTSRDFHPTDIAEDADGSLLVVDTGGWFYIGCPTSQHAKPDVLGAIYRVRRNGATTPADPRGLKLDWAKQTDQQLVSLLDDERFAVRESAIVECARHGESIVPTLETTIRKGGMRVSQNAVWALTRIGSGSAQAAIRLALSSPHSTVRLTACHSLATYPDPAALDRLLELLQQEDAPVRRQAATAIGRIGDPKSVPALLTALSRPIDREEEHALIYALIEINDPAATRDGMIAKSEKTRRGALIALDQMRSGQLTADDVVPLADADDLTLQRAAADVFSRHADWSHHAADMVARLLSRPESVPANAAVIRKSVTKFLADPSVGELVGRALHDTQTPPATRDLLLSAIADGQGLPLHENWVEPLQRLLDANDSQTVEAALAAVAAIKTDRFREWLEQIGGDTNRSPLLRATALQIASGQGGNLTDGVLDLLIDLVATGAPGDSLRAAQKIGSAGLSKEQLIRLAPELEHVNSSQLHELLRPFARSDDLEVSKAFLAAMENASGLTSLSPHEFSDVILRYPPELLPMANSLLDRVRDAELQKLARVDKLLPLLKQGDASRGHELFFAEKSKCATCHRVADKGGKVGPDLTTIGANRAGRDLLESIVLPSSTIVRDYEPYTIATTDGRVLSGLIARETRDTVYLQQPTGDPVAVPRSDIESMTAGTVSIMPNGLEEVFNEQQLADVIAYLQSLK